MKALYRKIAQIMRNRTLRKRLRRYMSVIAVIVVFVTTYATVLPAITLGKTASCGIEEHQHSDDCYEYELICGQEESEGHHHDDSCYTVEKELVCQEKEHKHSEENGCYDEEGNLICELPEHVHDDSCYEEVKTLTCDQEESEGHHHTDECYKKVLTCGKEVHTHSAECYDSTAVDSSAENNTENTSAESIPENAAAGTSEAAKTDLTSVDTQPENYVPELDSVELETVLGKHTGFYYYHPEDGEELPESSTEITDWQELKEDTVLASKDLVRMYLPYSIPAGSLNATNPVVQYHLPENIHLTDKQVESINKNKNGFYYDVKDTEEDADKYLGAEAIEGDRRPDEELNDGAQEYISAIVRVKESSHGRQDLIFTFVPYTIEKNQTVYDADKNPVSTGEKITGWFACDFTMEQIDWLEEEHAKSSEIIFAAEDKEKDIEEISYTLKLAEESQEAEKKEDDSANSNAEEFKSGTLTADGKDYTIILDYAEDAKIPENAELSVSEITEQSDKNAYNDCLAQAEDHVAESGEKQASVDKAATRFFDIEIIIKDEDGRTHKIEPAAPVSVRIQIPEAASDAVSSEASKQDPTVLHFAENGLETIDSTKTETSAGTNNSGAASKNGQAEEILFEADSFSVYGVVYTVDFHAEVISASGDTYEVTVRYEANAMIPEGAELKVREILPEDEEYQAVQKKAGKELAEEMKKTIPAHPVLFDIAIYNGETKIEPAEGSTVQVEIKLVKECVTGIYSDENSPVLINDKPVEEEELKNVRKLQVIHDTEAGELDIVEVQEQNDDEHVVGQFTTDSFSNWLVFLDEDLADINVTTSDSLTLRPYSEWVWKTSNGQQEGNWLFPDSDWNVSYSGEWINNQYNPYYYTIYTHKTNGSQFRAFSKTDGELNETYTVITSISLNAGNFDIQNDKGKTIHVHVTQGNASPAPDPVPGIPELTVNLFDYDVPYKNGQPDFTRSGNLDSSGNKASSVYNETVNVGHNLDFLGWGYDGDGYGVNSYTNEYAKQEIVKNELDSNGYPVLNDGSNQSLDYLFNTSSKNSSVYGFANAGGLFQMDNQGYYFYNSNVNYAKYDLDSNQFILYGHTYSQNTGGSNGANAKPIGFFPFHEYDTSETQPSMNHNKNLNHHFGMSMSVDFEIPKDRQMEDQNGNKHEIIYEFSGDDDLWVFVDDELALDIGGIHQPVTGSINFTTGVIKVHGKDDITKTFDVGGHTLKMFYLERGGCDSNLSVKFNLPLVKGKAGVNVAKKSLENASSNPDQFLPGAVFGIWENENCSGDPYMTGTSDANGHIDFGDLPIKTDGQKYYIKEIVPPQGYLPNTTVFTATAGEKDQNGNYSFTITDGTTPVETIGQEPVYAIVRDQKPEPINLTIQKKWENADGSEMNPPEDVTAEFEVLRYVTKVKVTGSVAPSTDETTLELFKYKNWGTLDITSYKTYKFPRGAKVKVSYEYNRSYQGSSDYKRYEINEGTSNNVDYSGSFEITIPETGKTDIRFYDNWKGQSYGNGTALLNLSAEVIEMPHVDPTVESETYFDEEYSYPLNLPHDGAWTNTAPNLPAMSSDDEYTYYYSYFIKEKNVPAGFETVYYDGQNHQIPDPASLQTNTSGTQTIANRKLMDVPVIKDWEDFSGDEFTWTADFQLEERELKVNSSDPDADDAITQWTAVDGKTLRVTKGQTPTPVFTGLPRYRMHSNGTLYRILYSVEETAYEVKEGDTVVSKWDAEHGHTIGHRYTPQFTQDAGGNEQGEKPYEIKLANTLHNPTVTNTINLSLKKEWTAGGSDYNPGNGASARFVLKRFYHEEYRNYSHVDDMTDMVTITLDVAGTGTNPTITVPRGAMVSISGKVLAGVNANSIQFTRQDGTYLTKIIDNTTSQSLKPFDITFEATQNETVTLYRGDNYVSGGREGFRLTDHGDQNTPKVDKHFSQEFTLDDSVNWIKQFSSLPQIEEDEMDEVSHVQTITVYTYYFEEVDCTPSGFHPVFETTNGQLLADVNNPVDTSQDLIAENQANEGSLKLKKLVRVNEFDPLGNNVSDADKTKADGTYTFTIEGKEGTRTAGLSHTVTITVLNGAVSSATIDGGTATLGNDGSVLLSGLVTGQYTVTEEESANAVCIGVSAAQAATTDVDNRTAEITVVEDVPDVETQQVQYTNNYASSGEDIAHVSVRKTFIGLKPNEIPANFQVNATVKATIDGIERTFTYTLKGPLNQQEDGVTLTTSTDQDGNPVWNWRIAIAGLRPDAVLTIEETGYPVAGYDVSTTTNGVANKTKYEGTVSADTVIQNFESHVFTPNNEVTFPVNDTGDTATIFMARLTSDKTTLVISKNRLTLSEKAKIEEQLQHMENAEDWTHGGNAVLYYNFEEAGSNQIIVKGRTVTYSDTNGGQITFNKKCQWTMVGRGDITYVPGRPADVNFVNRYTEIPLEIDIVKVDKENSSTKLKGAVFTLRKLSGPVDNPENPPEPLPSGEFPGTTLGDSVATAPDTGRTSFSNLTSGYYEITEKTPPAGYVLTDTSPIYFKIAGGSVTRIEWSAEQSKWIDKGDDAMVSFEEAHEASGGNPASNVTFTVGNTPGAALPSTGGPGTNMLYHLGITLISLAAGAGLLMKRRRRNAA